MSDLFVRVKDLETKHEFDVHESDPRIEEGVLRLVKRKQFPPSPVARMPRYYVPVEGISAQETTTDETPADSPVSSESSAK